MKKMFRVMVVALVGVLLLTGCIESAYKLEFVNAERVDVYGDEYFAVYTDFTNGAPETVCPADVVDVVAYQNGVELTIVVYSGDVVEDAVQCDTNIQSETTARVVWLFELRDDSPVSIEFSDGQEFEVEP